MPIFSLICATINRFDEMDNLLLSLTKQTFKNFEIIIVDQNEDKKLENIINLYNECIDIIYVKSPRKGLSINRNIGLEYAQGEILCFPDDDCEYKPDTLDFVYNFFLDNTAYNFFTFNFEDKFFHHKNFGGGKRKITFFNFYHSAISFTIFIKKEAFSYFRFDECLGVGARFGAGEEGDLIVCLLNKKCCGFFNGSYTIYHPKATKGYDIKRGYNYGMGLGALFKKIIIYYKQYYLFMQYCWFLIRNIFALIIRSRKRYYFNALKGKIIGFIKYHINDIFE
jgi:glycosyltransferase involved in cell wall biosynthesis